MKLHEGGVSMGALLMLLFVLSKRPLPARMLNIPAKGDHYHHPEHQSLSCSPSRRLHYLDWWYLQLSPKYSVPEATRYAETILVVGEVVLQMIFLQLLPIVREASMV